MARTPRVPEASRLLGREPFPEALADPEGSLSDSPARDNWEVWADGSPGWGWGRGSLISFAAAITLAVSGAALAFNSEHLRRGPYRGNQVVSLGLGEDHAGCHTAVEGDRCWKEITWARTTGLTTHPEWYRGLDASSSSVAFQAVVHHNAPGRCPMPCSTTLAPPRPETDEEEWARARFGSGGAGEPVHKEVASTQKPTTELPTTAPPATTLQPTTPEPVFQGPVEAIGECQSPLELLDDQCHTAIPGEKCYDEVEWARSDGLRFHPTWYPGLTKESSREEFQEHLHRESPLKCPRPCTQAAAAGTCVCPPGLTFYGLDDHGSARCEDASTMAAASFYMYRSLGDPPDGPFENINAADLPGLMWYLHSEIVSSSPRKYGVKRIVRYRVTVRTPPNYWEQHHKQFVPFMAFSDSSCTVPGCGDALQKDGFAVGCQVLDHHVANYMRDLSRAEPPQVKESAKVTEVDLRKRKLRKLSWWPFSGPDPTSTTTTVTSTRTSTTKTSSTTTETTSTRTTSTATTTSSTTGSTTPWHTASSGQIPLRGGVWYSLPGACPALATQEKTSKCIKDMPGGRCDGDAWYGDCTYKVEEAGEISLDELVGISDYDAFVKDGNVEYDPATDKGVNCNFWDGILDAESCKSRMDRVTEIFSRKYPTFPATLPEPPCL